MLNIAKDMMIGDHAPSSYLAALSYAQRYEAKRLRMAKDKGCVP